MCSDAESCIHDGVDDEDDDDFWGGSNSYNGSFEMVKVDGGTFIMGATEEQGSDAYDNEKPAHQVTLSSFYIGKYEVTQEEWESVMGTTTSFIKGENLPVEFVSWNMIVGTSGEVGYTVNGVDYCTDGFCYKLSQKKGGGARYRLPTEAEWEYAARGGRKSKGYKYSGSNTVGDVAWYYYNSNKTKHSVGTKMPNELGLYDMSGNVWEWCSDRYGSYSSEQHSYRVIRGGYWGYYARDCRVSVRNFDPSYGVNSDYGGFRLASSSK
ncbi:MAG: formylglycine-generating enzyme family protein [Tannerella sp.]|jgi:formylglycine-generating enzyme required for sulfatase activity|nr:formylglycine-generating enzyme family protein [Tannerella sp.]